MKYYYHHDETGNGGNYAPKQDVIQDLVLLVVFHPRVKDRLHSRLPINEI